ncbi:MAG: acyl-CoA desaturase [Candidatus Dormibacteraeota bacterium]|uniref:Acyl-CoA desaturase n=1 Tax=Candidatus Aeolococcus gillhamiae TaxID=3127015 RepID=A0A934JRP8_9BACT|nr:acyl-CoA desaturase [Candidatus Dormibacteraeota bacterium]
MSQLFAASTPPAVTPTIVPAPPETVMKPADPYVELKRVIAGRGLLERSPRRQIVPSAGHALLLAAIIVGITFTRGTWWVLLWTAPAALLFGQIGFLAHDATHNQILHTSRANYILSVLLFNLGLGGSRGWWAERHNTHHAQPNRLGVDPDIEGGVVAVTDSQARESRGFVRFMIRNQGRTIAPLLSLSALQIRAYSALFIKARSLRNPRAELALFAVHYAVYVTALVFVLGVGGGLLFAAVHQLLLGLYLGAAFLPNHFGMTVLMPGDQLDFLPRQVVTARNLRAGRVTDYFFGPLGCQIEHHLFPAMPRHNLRAAGPIVRQVCQEQGILYRETSPREAFAQVYRHLRSVGRAAIRPAQVAEVDRSA